MRLILARHGETPGNRDRLALGRLDVPLNDTGLAQARALARFLERTPLVAVYSSPLQRARKTAEEIAEPHNLGVVVEEGLTEMDVGEMDGHTIQDMLKLHADFLKGWMGPEAGDLRMPGGETLQEVQDRAWEVVERLIERHERDAICAVSHNFTIHCILCRALGLPLAEFRRFRHDLAAVSVLSFTGGGAVLVGLNNVSHLEEDGLAERPVLR